MDVQITLKNQKGLIKNRLIKQKRRQIVFY
jgi:hypothetical protein